jgi:hypothetical protein
MYRKNGKASIHSAALSCVNAGKMLLPEQQKRLPLNLRQPWSMFALFVGFTGTFITSGKKESHQLFRIIQIVFMPLSNAIREKIRRINSTLYLGI